MKTFGPREAGMNRIRLYCYCAAECLQLARTVRDPSDRQLLVEMAIRWHELATRAARSVKRDGQPPQASSTGHVIANTPALSLQIKESAARGRGATTDPYLFALSEVWGALRSKSGGRLRPEGAIVKVILCQACAGTGVDLKKSPTSGLVSKIIRSPNAART